MDIHIYTDQYSWAFVNITLFFGVSQYPIVRLVRPKSWKVLLVIQTFLPIPLKKRNINNWIRIRIHDRRFLSVVFTSFLYRLFSSTKNWRVLLVFPTILLVFLSLSHTHTHSPSLTITDSPSFSLSHTHTLSL